MKKTTIRIFVLTLAIVMLTCMFAGCGKSKMTVTVGVQLGEEYINYMYDKNADNEEFIIPQEHRNFLNNVSVEIAYAEGEQVSALAAFKNAAAEYDLDYTLDKTGKSVSIINDYKGFSEKDENGEYVTYFWSYTINGVEPETGRADDNMVKDGDVIVFTLTSASASEFEEDNY